MENSNKILNIENIGNILTEQECLSFSDFFKILTLELLQSKFAQGEKYKINLEDIEEIAENLVNNDEIYYELDKYINEEIENYKK